MSLLKARPSDLRAAHTRPLAISRLRLPARTPSPPPLSLRSQVRGERCGKSLGRDERDEAASMTAASKSASNSSRLRYRDRDGQGLRNHNTSKMPVSCRSTYATNRDASDWVSEPSQIRQASPASGRTSHTDACFGGSGSFIVMTVFLRVPARLLGHATLRHAVHLADRMRSVSSPFILSEVLGRPHLDLRTWSAPGG